MEFSNYLSKAAEQGQVSRGAWQGGLDTLLLLTAPTAPHFAEELWERTGRPYSIHNQSWPTWEESLVAEEEMILVVQVNGKVRDRLTVPVSISEAEARELALSSERVKRHLDNRRVQSVIYVPGRLVNVVAQ